MSEEMAIATRREINCSKGSYPIIQVGRVARIVNFRNVELLLHLRGRICLADFVEGAGLIDCFGCLGWRILSYEAARG